MAAAMPLAAAMPMRTPVKEPGPADTANRPISSICSRAAERRFSTMGISVWEWVMPTSIYACASSLPSCTMAQEACFAALSIAKIFIRPSVNRDYAGVFVRSVGEDDKKCVLGQSVPDVFAPLGHNDAARVQIIVKPGGV